MKRIQAFAVLLVIAIIIGCSKVPISNRKQMNLLPESDMIAMSLQAYGEFLSENQVIADNNADATMVKRVGNRIAENVESYLHKHGQGSRVAGFEWEFNLVQDDAVNAWCMPGGKVVVYTGILGVTKNEAGLAVVMGHEIAHAIARHGNERMSQQILLQAGGATLDGLTQNEPQLTRELFLISYGVGSNMGSLAYSRTHETEADKMGLVFMAMAGYDPREAPKFWERMSQTGGGQPVEMLSTHPNHETRIQDLNAFMPEALKYYKAGL